MTANEPTGTTDWNLLGLYLSDHLTGSTAGIQRMGRMSKALGDTQFGPRLNEMTKELEQERDFIIELLDRFGLPRRSYRQLIASVGELVGRAKLNGRLVGTSPMTPVLESELMRSAVLGKIGGWQTMSAYGKQLKTEQARFDELIAMAERQIESLSDIHKWARERAFTATNGKAAQ